MRSGKLGQNEMFVEAPGWSEMKKFGCISKFYIIGVWVAWTSNSIRILLSCRVQLKIGFSTCSKGCQLKCLKFDVECEVFF